MYNFTYKVPNHKILTKEEEKALFIEYVKEPSLKKKNLIVGYYYKFTIQCATVYTRKYKHVQIEDLVGYAMLGLLDAVDKYDPNTEAKFTTYAIWWIKASIHRNVETYESLVRHPATTHVKLQKAITNNEYTEEINLLFDSVQGGTSLDAQLGDDNSGSLQGILADPNSMVFEDSVDNEQVRSLLLYHIDRCLDKREQKVVKEYFGLYGQEVSSKDLATELNVSRELIRHIRIRGLQKLKNVINKKDVI